jgi:hypothetical protein
MPSRSLCTKASRRGYRLSSVRTDRSKILNLIAVPPIEGIYALDPLFIKMRAFQQTTGFLTFYFQMLHIPNSATPNACYAIRPQTQAMAIDAGILYGSIAPYNIKS